MNTDNDESMQLQQMDTVSTLTSKTPYQLYTWPDFEKYVECN